MSAAAAARAAADVAEMTHASVWRAASCAVAQLSAARVADLSALSAPFSALRTSDSTKPGPCP
eukprot:CAMPEP_0175910820 /NCGR_PEP_ID=MMETSP0108-20121206/7871_1 /TAXON_ID=195067 ORGANISM="Goniomonas pacifica, Strain CCMP1869" /NCGR_SAMPLE_ID=MMETSP0108 /ASSEMBLY_ACC=CAM_ASM_000204 /LENGTH=62 /DNA_ID=CAMNT_0017233039 /DNA_START=146 /DNA_END=331 /DNA_ORIENTATION=-